MINLMGIFRRRRRPADPPPYDIIGMFCIPFENLARYQTTISYNKILNHLPFYTEARERMYDYYTIIIWDMRVIEWICVLTKGSPAMTVMYLTYLQYWCKVHNCRHPDLQIFKQIFSNGFPEEMEMRRLWYKCKISRHEGSDNLLDHRDALKPIQF
jgi:hypothetical protein